MTNSMPIAVANSLPTTENNKRLLIHPLIVGG
jgi:hypothetical protein